MVKIYLFCGGEIGGDVEIEVEVAVYDFINALFFGIFGQYGVGLWQNTSFVGDGDFGVFVDGGLGGVVAVWD